MLQCCAGQYRNVDCNHFVCVASSLGLVTTAEANVKNHLDDNFSVAVLLSMRCNPHQAYEYVLLPV